jgi:hypothetical protein
VCSAIADVRVIQGGGSAGLAAKNVLVPAGLAPIFREETAAQRADPASGLPLHTPRPCYRRTQDTFVPATSLSQCSTGYSAVCLGIDFLPSSPGCGTPGQVVQIWFDDGVVNPYYYFPLGAFTAAGTYSTVVYQGANTGTLTVTVVPEPSTFCLLVGPLTVLLTRVKGRQAMRGLGLSRSGNGTAVNC